MERGEMFIPGKHWRQWQNKSHYNFHTIHFSQNKSQPFFVPFTCRQNMPQPYNSQFSRRSWQLWAELPCHAPHAWGPRFPSLATSCPREGLFCSMAHHVPSCPQPESCQSSSLLPTCLTHGKSGATNFLLLSRQDTSRMQVKARNVGQTSLQTQTQLPKIFRVIEMRLTARSVSFQAVVKPGSLLLSGSCARSRDEPSSQL